MTLGRPHHIRVNLVATDPSPLPDDMAADQTAVQFVRVEPAGRIFVITWVPAVPDKPRRADRWTLDTFYVGGQEAVDFVRKMQEGVNAKLITPSEYADAVRSLRKATAKIPLW